MQADIDKRIAQAQRKGAGVYFLTGGATLLVLVFFALWLFFVKGYNLVVGPNEALPALKIETQSGLAMVSGSKIYTLGGKAQVLVSADTFQSRTINIDSQSPSNIEVLLMPSPAIINAHVSVSEELAMQEDSSQTRWVNDEQISYLQQTQWFLNGTLIHVGESLLHETVPGNYQLDIVNDYYESTSKTLTLNRAQEVDLKVGLKTINGTIKLSSLPSGIDVKMFDTVIGQTPISINVKGGQHKVSLVSENFKTIEDTIDVKASFLAPSRNYQMLAKQGVLSVQAKPLGGLLLINSVEYPLGTHELSAVSTHKIEYKKPGYASFSRTVELDKNNAKSLDINLQALLGTVDISTNVPATFSVKTLDGKAVKETEQAPSSLRLLSVGHIVEAKAKGYRTLKRQFTPTPNQNTSLSLNLLTEFEARRAEGRPLFISGLGINMRRFRGDAFTMGSPANETGRRRNEHQIEVDFSRQFWVSEKEISEAQFTAFLSANQRSQSNLPVTGVSWQDAALYCNWLSEQEGLPPFYRFVNGRYAGVNRNALGYRLPTEAEWEWLAKKAKRATPTVYVWGNQDKLRPNQGNFGDKSVSSSQLIVLDDYNDGQAGAAPVGSYKADRAGLFDLDGNVSEWVHDLYTNALPDTSQAHTDYLGVAKGEAWVVKGGNFETGRLRELRASFREFSSSGKPTIGFRIARYEQ
jgi:formylglycine-generating enzyme required for sulfatase activity